MRINILVFLLCCFSLSSCTFIIKKVTLKNTKHYSNYANTDISDMQLADKDGKQFSFGQLFDGQSVYLYTSKGGNGAWWADRAKKYNELRSRFEKYPDVAFVSLDICPCDSVNNFYRLIGGQSKERFYSLINQPQATPFIVGKDGRLLAYKAPRPNDQLLVDYVLYQARSGIDGTTASRTLVKSLNKHFRFKNKKMRDWYSSHFQQPLDSLKFSISSY